MEILLDYGHGGHDPGGVFGNLKEKDDVLRLGKLIKTKLESKAIRVYETRSGDEYLTLRERVELANSLKLDYIVSLHRNAYIPYKANGIEAFLYHKHKRASNLLADNILAKLSRLGFVNRGIKYSNFYILKNTRAKALLLEIGFIDNPIDNEIFYKNIEEISSIISQEIYKMKDYKK